MTSTRKVRKPHTGAMAKKTPSRCSLTDSEILGFMERILEAHEQIETHIAHLVNRLRMESGSLHAHTEHGLPF